MQSESLPRLGLRPRMRPEIEDGAKLLREAVGKAKKQEHCKGYLRSFCYAVPPDHALTAYSAIAGLDRRLVFRTLNSPTIDEDDEYGWSVGPPHPNQIRQWAIQDDLIARHGSLDPTDPWVDYVLGQLLMRKGDHAGADRKFAEAEANLPSVKAKPKRTDPGAEEEDPDADRETIRDARIRAWYKQGKGLAALAEFGHTTEGFTALAWLFDSDKDWFGFERLIAAYAEKKQIDTDLSIWGGKLAYGKKDYSAAARFFEQHLEKLSDEEPYSHYRYIAIDQLIRSYVRIGKPGLAQRVVDKYCQKEKHPSQKVLAAAANRNLEAVMAAMAEAAGDRPNGAAWLYADEDIGPLLRLSEFRTVREKFPEPNDGK